MVLGAVLLAAIILLAWGAARSLIVSAPLERADMIVVLSGSAAYGERTEWAAKLYAEGRAPRIVLTNDNQAGGWSSSQQRNPYFYERARNNLLRFGVPNENIEVLPEPVSSTYEEAVLIGNYAKTKGLRSLLIVTSAYHSRRALWTFQHLLGADMQIGLDPVADGPSSPPPSTWWLHLRGWRMVPVEYAKIVYYRLRYR